MNDNAEILKKEIRAALEIVFAQKHMQEIKMLISLGDLATDLVFELKKHRQND